METNGFNFESKIPDGTFANIDGMMDEHRLGLPVELHLLQCSRVHWSGTCPARLYTTHLSVAHRSYRNLVHTRPWVSPTFVMVERCADTFESVVHPSFSSIDGDAKWLFWHCLPGSSQQYSSKDLCCFSEESTCCLKDKHGPNSTVIGLTIARFITRIIHYLDVLHTFNAVIGYENKNQ